MAVNERILTSLINRGDKNGDVYISNPEDLLTDRELEIFRLMGKGFKRNDIAKFLNINVNTVGTYRERIKEKLNISSSNELMAMAVSWVRKIEKEDE